MDAVICDFSHVYEHEEFCRGDGFRWIDCTRLTGTDCYCDSEGERVLDILRQEAALELDSHANAELLRCFWQAQEGTAGMPQE